MSSFYNPLLRLDLQKKQDIPEPPTPEVDDALSISSTNPVQNKVITGKINDIEHQIQVFQDIDVKSWSEFLAAVNISQTISTRIHFRANITVESQQTINLSNCLIFGHYYKFIVNGITTILVGNYADFEDVLFQGANASGAATPLFRIEGLASTSCRFYFNQCRFYNFLEQGDQNVILVHGASGSSIHTEMHMCVINGESAMTTNNTFLVAHVANNPCISLKVVALMFAGKDTETRKVGLTGTLQPADIFCADGSCEYTTTKPDNFFQWGTLNDPSQFATAAQGEKADSALQSISKGTDGDYITTTIGAKAGNSQTVSSSLTIQALSNAKASAKGLAEASDVKEYIGNNTATPAQGTKADSALQQVEHGTDGQFITTTVTQKANNVQTIYTSLTLQGIATADGQHQGVAEASDVRNYLDIIAATSEAYGVMWDTANPSPTLTRVGDMTNHALLPVQSQMVGGVMADDGTFTPFDNQADWTQATQARDGSDGQVMVRLPKHWRRCSTFGTYNIVMLSAVEIPGYVEVREQYVSAYEASLQRSTLKLSSVNNATADYRGGQNEASWDGTHRTLLNRPASNLDLTEFRTYARNRAAGTSWNCLTYEAVRTIFWLFAVEYATLNSQSDYTSELDANGYHQGGLGIGVSDWNGDAWNSFNGYAPLIPCGVLDEYGIGTAVKNFSIYNSDTTLAHTFQCNKYRGIEMPFGHIWKSADGVLINVESNPGVSTAYVTTDTAYFSSTSIADYSAICNTYRVDSYIKGIVFNADGDIFATTSGGNSTSYYCDHYWDSNIPSSGSQLRALLFGGSANRGFACGLACAYSFIVPGDRHRRIGSRLCFVP